MTDATDNLTQRMRQETSEAVLMAVRAWSQAANRWSQSIHQPEYDRAVERIKARREAKQ